LRIVAKYFDGEDYHVVEKDDPKANLWSLEERDEEGLYVVVADFYRHETLAYLNIPPGRPLNKGGRSEGRYPDGYLRFRLVDEDDNVLEDYDTQEQVEMRMSLHEGTYLSDAEDVA